FDDVADLGRRDCLAATDGCEVVGSGIAEDLVDTRAVPAPDALERRWRQRDLAGECNEVGLLLGAGQRPRTRLTGCGWARDLLQCEVHRFFGLDAVGRELAAYDREQARHAVALLVIQDLVASRQVSLANAPFEKRVANPCPRT